MIWHTFFQPFIEYGFMRRALVVCLALSISTTALGVFLQLRRMSLMGDALSHAILPGVAVGYLLSGLSLLAMSIGGFVAGITVALLAGLVSRRTPLKEDASFAGFYLGSLALGVTLVSLRGSNVDLLHLLFGSILAVDNDAALFVTGVCMFTLIVLAMFYRGLVTEAFDTAWLQVNARWLPGLLHGLFLALLVLNLVAGFQVLGTLMAVGLMMLPAVAARCWVRTLPALLLMAGISGIVCAWLGLSLSWAMSLPAGPSIVLTASALFFISILLGREAGSLAVCGRIFNARGNDETYRTSSGSGARAGDDVAGRDGENAECGHQLLDTGGHHPGGGRRSCEGDDAGGAGRRSAYLRTVAEGQRGAEQGRCGGGERSGAGGLA